MKFSVMVNEGPYTHQAADTAYQFSRAVLDAGHEIFRVFFYHDGVHNGTRMTTPPQDDRHIVDRWSELAHDHDIDLVVCVAAAQRRSNCRNQHSQTTTCRQQTRPFVGEFQEAP